MKKTKFLSKFLLAVLLMTTIVVAQEMNPEAGKLYNEGNSLLKAGNFRGAIDNYDKALAIEKDYRIFYQKGVAQKKAGDIPGAMASFEECLKLKNDFEAGYNALGGVYFSTGDYEKSITNFEKVLTLSSNTSIQKKVKKNLALAYSKLAKTEMQNGNSSKAIEHLNKAVDYNNYDAAYLSLAELYSDLNDYDKCIDASENALKYKSSISSGGPYYYLGVAYKGKGDNSKAVEMFKKASSDASYKKTAEYELSQLK
jgi:tetratricopeptide (TPR) repeat protein